MITLPLFRLLSVVLCGAIIAWDPAGTGLRQEAETVTICDLQNNPAAYDHKLIRVTGFVSYGFEDFTFFDPACSAWPYIWLEYGGTAAAGTMYCCGVTNARSRRNQLTIEGISIPLQEDQPFRQFDELLHRSQDRIVRATLVGRFFAGRETKIGIRSVRGGYGHMGCCSLFAVQQVVDVRPQLRAGFDYGSSPDQPDTRIGCGYEYLTSIRGFGEALEAQRIADAGQREWAFTNARRVAANTIANILGISENSIASLSQVRSVQGRVVYSWRQKGQSSRYMIVVSRPYWLSFYSQDPQRVAWVVTAVYKIRCG